MIDTFELIKKLEGISPQGFQISVRYGLLNSTKAIYIYKSLIYLFNMEDEFIFKPLYGYKTAEFLEEYGKYYWEVEEIID